MKWPGYCEVMWMEYYPVCTQLHLFALSLCAKCEQLFKVPHASYQESLKY